MVTLSSQQLQTYKREGFCFPLRVLDSDTAASLQLAALDHINAAESGQVFELSDPVQIKSVEGPDSEPILAYDDSPSDGTGQFPFLFNVWRRDARFSAIARDPSFGELARQLLGADRVLLFEDNIVIKNPQSKNIPFHQDYSYWPLETPDAVTIWIALDHVSSANGGMLVAGRTHELGNRLPVSFGDGSPWLVDEWEGVPEVPQNPEDLGYEVTSYALAPGECGVHSALVWHGSSPNESPTPRVGYVLRYVAEGTIWLGGRRVPYDDIGCPIGAPLTTAHFPLV